MINKIEIIENHFKVYKNLVNKIYVKNMELIKLKEDWYNISGTRYDDVKIKGGIPYDIADQMHFIVEKEKELKATINYKEELKRVHENEINKLSDHNKRTILKLFYLDKCSIKEISCCLRVSEGHVKKLKRWGVTEFINKVIENKVVE